MSKTTTASGISVSFAILCAGVAFQIGAISGEHREASKETFSIASMVDAIPNVVVATPAPIVRTKVVEREVRVPVEVVRTVEAPRTMWKGLEAGEVVVCPKAVVEVDDYAGGQFAHCDGEALR